MKAAPAGGERGFILVGVVMFMLALTILGLSLYALSSYEAQFFYASASREQSLQSSESGMEVVRALLAAPPHMLQSAQLAVGQFGITRALAYQQRSSDPNDTTSRGPVNGDSTLVIEIAARTGGQERIVQSRFVPTTVKNPYQQLISTGLGIRYNTQNGSPHSLELQGAVWQRVQTSADTAWIGHVSWPIGRPMDTSSAPRPLANAFVDAATAVAPAPPPSLLQPPYWIELDNPDPTPQFYELAIPSPRSGRHDDEFNWYGFYCDQELEIRVHGTAVWILPRGVCVRGTVRVVPDAVDPANPNVLVIVAKPNLLDPMNPDRGIWFKGGLSTSGPDSTQVFLVSEGDITLAQDNVTIRNVNLDLDSDARALSIAAGGHVELMGPANGFAFRLTHASVMDALADQLLANGALPPTSGGGTAFTYARGTWLERHLP